MPDTERARIARMLGVDEADIDRIASRGTVDRMPVIERDENPRPSTFGAMKVIDTDQGAGRMYRCACGWVGWSAWGHARRHAAECERSGEVPGDAR